MQSYIKKILLSNQSEFEKEKELKKLEEDIEIARNILTGKYQHCPRCNDYYLSGSFATIKETKRTRICIYDDPINSGGNEYADGIADITYAICPKGHKYEIDRTERRV